MKKIFVLFIINMLCAHDPSTPFILNLTELFPAQEMEAIIQKNRETLSMVPEWVEDATYQTAVYWYGLPESVRHLIDRPIGNDITYSDAMVHLTKKLKKKICYLELGTSFGKNFLQVAHAISHSTLVGFDFEKISPAMKRFLINDTEIATWNSLCKDSFKKDQPSLTRYNQITHENTVYYLNADLFDEGAWQRLHGMKFNMIFSDALHTPEALLNEYQMLTKYDLIDPDECIFVWDDLGGEMTKMFMCIFDMLGKKYQLSMEQGFVIPLRGWLGTHMHHHNVGIILHTQEQEG
jgi:hypothetical protein